MARPQKSNAEYFSHDADMRNDPRVKALRRTFKHTGYAAWNYILETLTDSDGFSIEWNEVNTELLAGDYDIESSQLTDIINYCIKIGLLQTDGDMLYSENHQKRFASLIQKRERRRMSQELQTAETASNRVMDGQNPPQANLSDEQNTQSIVEYSRVEESKVENEIHTHTKNDLRGVQGGNPEAMKFLEWIEQTFPDIAEMKEPLTVEDAEWLVGKYDSDFLKTIIASMHNNDVSGKVGIRPPEKVKVRAITTIRSYIANAKKQWK